MKKILLSILSLLICLSGCSSTRENIIENDYDKLIDNEVLFDGLDDPELLEYTENNIYNNLINDLDENYYIENVEAIYYSKEYIDELSYNSKENIYFGYTLKELEQQFHNQKYIFTLGENGNTVVTEFENYDSTYDQVIKNTVIGSGVILICVTVSVVSGPLGQTAISAIFATSAKTASIFALSTGTISGTMTAIVTGYQTGDLEETTKAALLSASEGFKIGAFSGAITGGYNQYSSLKGATLNGLTMNEAALIQNESGLPLEFIKNFHSMDEYEVYKSAGLKYTKVNGKYALTQSIDWNLKDENGYTNAQRVELGKAPIDSTGKSYELHHIGQQADSPLAILSNEQHHGNYNVVHSNTGSNPSNIDRPAFNIEKKNFWKAFYALTNN